MTRITITESGMNFGPFEEDKVFHIEKSVLYESLGEGIKTAEFVWLRTVEDRPIFWVVEAKSSSPRPQSSQEFQNFLVEIGEKWVNSLSLTISAIIGRHGSLADLPETWLSTPLADLDVKLVLVIRGHQPDWLAPLRDALNRELRPIIKTLALGSPVFVLNEAMAIKHGLLASE